MGMQSAIEIPPRFGDGFLADVKTDDEHLRLWAKVEEEGWTASVYDMETHKWKLDGESASDAADAKQCAENYARYLVPGDYQIYWYEIPKQG